MNRLDYELLARVLEHVTDICVGVVGVDQPRTIMPITRRAVLDQLATASDAERRKTTTIEVLASALDTDEPTIEAHLHGLAACELARIDADGRVRVTITGDGFLDLDAAEMVIVDVASTSSET